MQTQRSGPLDRGAEVTLPRRQRRQARRAGGVLAALVILVTLATLSGCAPWIYDLRQTAALQDCDKLVQINDQRDCRQRNSRPFSDYEKERDKVGQRPASGAGVKSDALCFKRSSGETLCPN